MNKAVKQINTLLTLYQLGNEKQFSFVYPFNTLFLFIQSLSHIWINKARSLFLGPFGPLLNQTVFLEAAGAVLKIGSSLKLNHHRKIRETLCKNCI